MTLATQPSVPKVSGSQVCQMSMARKWDLGEFSKPMPWIMATFPSSYIFFKGAILGLKASSSSMGSTLSWGIPTLGRLS